MLRVCYFLILALFVNGALMNAQLSGCNSSSAIVYTTFPSNSVTNYTSYANSLLLCGPNTIVFDTLVDGWGNNPIRNMVFIGEFSKYIVQGIDDPYYVAIFVKSTATLDFRPAASLNSAMSIIIELGATVWNNSGYNINVDTCASLIFPPGCASTEVAENINSKPELINIWPNPAKDYLHLNYTFVGEEPPTEIVLYNSLGQLFQEHKPVFENNKTKIPTSGLENGLYFLELKNSSGLISKKRFVVAN
jgi:hypothetical protein